MEWFQGPFLESDKILDAGLLKGCHVWFIERIAKTLIFMGGLGVITQLLGERFFERGAAKIDAFRQILIKLHPVEVTGTVIEEAVKRLKDIGLGTGEGKAQPNDLSSVQSRLMLINMSFVGPLVAVLACLFSRYLGGKPFDFHHDLFKQLVEGFLFGVFAMFFIYLTCLTAANFFKVLFKRPLTTSDWGDAVARWSVVLFGAFIFSLWLPSLLYGSPPKYEEWTGGWVAYSFDKAFLIVFSVGLALELSRIFVRPMLTALNCIWRFLIRPLAYVVQRLAEFIVFLTHRAGGSVSLLLWIAFACFVAGSILDLLVS